MTNINNICYEEMCEALTVLNIIAGDFQNTDLATRERARVGREVLEDILIDRADRHQQAPPEFHHADETNRTGVWFDELFEGVAVLVYDAATDTLGPA